MAGMIANYSNFEVRAVVIFFEAEGMSRSEIHHGTFSAEMKCVCGVTNLKTRLYHHVMDERSHQLCQNGGF
jgi:hypothetical protein